MINNSENKIFSALKPQLRLHRFLFYFITLVALVLLYNKFSDAELIKELFLRSNLFWLIGIIVTQFFSYWSLALNYQDVLQVKDLKIGVKALLPVTFVIQFLNQALPSATISGQAFFVYYLKKYGLSVVEGIGRAIIELLTLYIAFGFFFLISSFLIFQSGALAANPSVVYLTYVFIFFGVIFTGIFLAVQKGKRGRVVRWTINRLHRYFENSKQTDHASHLVSIFNQFKKSINISELAKHKMEFWRAVVWQGFNLFLNVLTLYLIGLAVGVPLPFTVAFVTFILTKFLSMVSFVPGAFGVFEGGMTLILVSFNLPTATAFAVTLIFRAFTFWFPMPIGWVLYRRYINR